MSWFAKKATKGKVAAIMSVIMTLTVYPTYHMQKYNSIYCNC